MWLCHKRHSKRSGEEVQCMSYDGKHRSTMERAFQMGHVCWNWGGIQRR